MLITRRAHFMKYGGTFGVILFLLILLDHIYTRRHESHDVFIHGAKRFKKEPTVNNISCDLDRTQYDVDIRVLILTFNRPKSLLRLLESLNKVDFLGDKVAIEVWIDRSTRGEINTATFEAADNFRFYKGSKHVFSHTRHAGLYGQWMETWKPRNEDNEIAVFLEDDLSVSPMFYRYLKNVQSKYKANEKINGFSLHSCTINHGTGKGYINVPSEHIVFLYPVLGTWGFSPKRENWINYIQWYHNIHKNKTFQPFVPGILPTQWYKQFLKNGKTHTMWSMWHIYYSWINKEYCLFPNFPNCTSLTKNFYEVGLHVSRKMETNDRLLNKWGSNYENLPDVPLTLDFRGNVVNTNG